MKFSQFCDEAENTEQEQQLLQFFKQEGMEQAEQIFAKMSRIPVIGKIFTALTALSSYESIAAFRQSIHYRNLMNWNFKVDFDKKGLYITPSDEQKKKAVKIMAMIGAVVAVLAICRKLCCKKK